MCLAAPVRRAGKVGMLDEVLAQLDMLKGSSVRDKMDSHLAEAHFQNLMAMCSAAPVMSLTQKPAWSPEL